MSTPLSRWADRAPAWRWPLIYAVILILWGLAGIADPDELEGLL